MTKKGKDSQKKKERVAAFHPEFIEDLPYWVKMDRKVAIRAFHLIESVIRVRSLESESLNRSSSCSQALGRGA